MLNHRSLLLGLAGLLALVATTTDSSAYQVEPAPWRALVAKSELAVHGHVMASWGDWAPDGSGRVITRYEILVWNQRQLRGPRDGAHVIVTLPGGRMGNRQTVIPGLAPLAIGDELLLLLTHTAWGWQPIGYELGIVRLNRRPSGEVSSLDDLVETTLNEGRVKP
jgi:hypothetical protein